MERDTKRRRKQEQGGDELTSTLRAFDEAINTAILASSSELAGKGLARGGTGQDAELSDATIGLACSSGTADNSCSNSPGDSNLKVPTADRTGPAEPANRLEWLQMASRCGSLVELGIAVAWGVERGFLGSLGRHAGPSRAAKHGSLFPLPVEFPHQLPTCPLPGTFPNALNLSVKCWLGLCCTALNAMYGLAKQGQTRKRGKIHAAALNHMENRILRFLSKSSPSSFTFDDVAKDLSEKRISYTGEEVSQPIALSVEQIQKSLPPDGHGSSVPLLPLLRGRTKYLLENPHEVLRPAGERSTGPVTAKVHIQKGQELKVFLLLAERRVVTWIPADDTFRDERGPITNGLFGVVEPNKFTETGLPILRVIMNLVPCNALFTLLAMLAYCRLQQCGCPSAWMREKRSPCPKVICPTPSICSRCPQLGDPS